MTAREYFEVWWNAQTRMGDPERRPNLVRDAFLDAFELGRADAIAEMDATGLLTSSV